MVDAFTYLRVKKRLSQGLQVVNCSITARVARSNHRLFNSSSIVVFVSSMFKSKSTQYPPPPYVDTSPGTGSDPSLSADEYFHLIRIKTHFCIFKKSLSNIVLCTLVRPGLRANSALGCKQIWHPPSWGRGLREWAGPWALPQNLKFRI